MLTNILILHSLCLTDSFIKGILKLITIEVETIAQVTRCSVKEHCTVYGQSDL